MVVNCALAKETSSALTVSTGTVDQDYLSLLSEFPDISKVHNYQDCPAHHDVVGHISTSGPPVACRPRGLSPEKFKIARREFEHMLELGIIRPLSGSWSSPLHMVPKKTQGD